MKATMTIHKTNRRPLPYPNAAEPRYFLNKAIDAALAVATGMGTLTILFFFITM